MITRAISLFAASLLAGLALAETLIGDAIKREIIGKTVCVSGKSGPVCVRHKADGTSEVVSGLPKQKGKWHIAQNQHCVTWEKIRNGKELCFSYVKEGAVYSAPEAGGKISFPTR